MEPSRAKRSTRGAYRLPEYHWDVSQIRADLDVLADEQWSDRAYGTNWSDLALFVKDGSANGKRHRRLAELPGLAAVMKAFPAPVMDMCLASLDAGGVIKEHRDISGGTAANIIRLHIPIVTAPEVEFLVDRQPVTMAEGEVWHLDTTYLHSVANRSDINRIHLIIDLEETAELRALLPASDFRDQLHSAYFYLICVSKGASLLVSSPRQFFKRVVDFARLRFGRRSVLYGSDDIQ